MDINFDEFNKLTIDEMIDFAKQGNPKAQYYLSITYKFELKDKERSWYWINESAKAGYYKAIESLAADYAQGIPGIIQSDSQMSDKLLELAFAKQMEAGIDPYEGEPSHMHGYIDMQLKKYYEKTKVKKSEHEKKKDINIWGKILNLIFSKNNFHK